MFGSLIAARPEAVRELLGFAVALGIGLLIGAERERRKEQRPGRLAAGIRTFSIAALVGAAALAAGGVAAFAAAIAGIGALAAVSALAGSKSDDPGITTEVALILTVLLGGLAIRAPGPAAMIGVAVAILLAARTPLHRFVASVLSEGEVRDALVLAAATLIVLPLLPDGRFGPYQVFNPRAVWLLVVLVLSVSAAGYVAVRLAGARFGLPLAGLLSGFVSSTATIGAMAARAKADRRELPGAAAAAVLSNVATMVQLAIVLAAADPSTLRATAPSLLAGGVVAVLYAAFWTARALSAPVAKDLSRGRAFSLKSALAFAGAVTAVLFISAACRVRFGEAGLILASAVGGLADAHAAAISMASIVAAGQAAPHDVLAPILVGVSSNTLSKLFVAYAGGGRRFLVRIAPGLALMVAAIWAAPLLVV